MHSTIGWLMGGLEISYAFNAMGLGSIYEILYVWLSLWFLFSYFLSMFLLYGADKKPTYKWEFRPSQSISIEGFGHD